MNSINQLRRSRSCSSLSDSDQACKYRNNLRRDDEMNLKNTGRYKDAESVQPFSFRTSSENTLSNAYLNTLVCIVNMDEFLKREHFENVENSLTKEDNDELSTELRNLTESEESLRSDMIEAESILLEGSTVDENGSTYTTKEAAYLDVTPTSKYFTRSSAKSYLNSSPTSVLDHPYPGYWNSGKNDEDQEHKEEDIINKLMVPVLRRINTFDGNLSSCTIGCQQSSLNHYQNKNVQGNDESCYSSDESCCSSNFQISNEVNELHCSDQIATKSSQGKCIENADVDVRHRRRKKIQSNNDIFSPSDNHLISKNNYKQDEKKNSKISTDINEVHFSDQIARKSSQENCVEKSDGTVRYRRRKNIQNINDTFSPSHNHIISKNDYKQGGKNSKKNYMRVGKIKNKPSWIDRFVSAAYGWTEYETEPASALQIGCMH